MSVRSYESTRFLFYSVYHFYQKKRLFIPFITTNCVFIFLLEKRKKFYRQNKRVADKKEDGNLGDA